MERIVEYTPYKKIIGILAFSSLFFCASIVCAQTSKVTIEPSQVQLNSLTLDQLEQAASAGDPDAQYALGYMYFYGKGVPQNTNTALNWIKRASVQGQEQAVRAMTLLAPVEKPPAEVPPGMTTTTTTSTTTATAVIKTTTVTPSSPVSSKNYTLQLLGTSSKKQADSYIKNNHMAGKATIYTTQRNGKAWYVVGYGTYASSNEAKAHIKSLPASIQAKKPFVKTISSLH